MQRTLLTAFLAMWLGVGVAGDPPKDRFVWLFGWGLGSDKDAAEMARIVETGARHGINGAVLSAGMDTLCRQPQEYFDRLRILQEVCAKNRVELIPAVFSIGYGGGALAHDRNLAEGLPVVDAPMRVKDGEARLESTGTRALRNGGFEEFENGRFKFFAFHDDPGRISFVDSNIVHQGKASVRLENFQSNPHGHGRVMQKVKLQPRRCYRFSIWVRTENLQPAGVFRATVLAGDRELAPRQFEVAPTAGWQRISFLFNSLDLQEVGIYAGVWGGKAGRLWLDDWSVEEVGPVNVLRRPGTPVTVWSADRQQRFEEGRDYEHLQDPSLQPFLDDKEALPLKVLAGSRIKDGDLLAVSWYHSMIINSSQVTVCMGEPAVYEVFEHEARLLAERLRPKRVFLNVDEVRMGGTCEACAGRNMGELLGQCITRQVESLRRHSPGVKVYAWSDMLDPHHNAKGNYYLVKGDYGGSWKAVPKDLVVAVWGGEPRVESLRFFQEQGFDMLVACYYDAENLDSVQRWLEASGQFDRVRGFMYTPWEKKYGLLPEFGDLLRQR